MIRWGRNSPWFSDSSLLAVYSHAEEPVRSLFSSYKDISPIHEGLRGGKIQKEERRKRDRERENRKSTQKVCKGRESKRVVFQERRGK